MRTSGLIRANHSSILLPSFCLHHRHQFRHHNSLMARLAKTGSGIVETAITKVAPVLRTEQDMAKEAF